MATRQFGLVFRGLSDYCYETVCFVFRSVGDYGYGTDKIVLYLEVWVTMAI